MPGLSQGCLKSFLFCFSNSFFCTSYFIYHDIWSYGEHTLSSNYLIRNLETCAFMEVNVST